MKQSCQRSRVYRATCAHFPATRRTAQGTCMLRLQLSLTNLEQKEVKVLCQLPACKAGPSLFLAHPKFLHAGNDGTSSISGNQDWGRLERRHSSISGSQDWGRLERQHSSISGSQDWGRLERQHSSISGSQDWGRLEEACFLCLGRQLGYCPVCHVKLVFLPQMHRREAWDRRWGGQGSQ